jgi:glycosyltransferase involved in cell wall biosynthesis
VSKTLLISIVTPSFNQASYLDEALRSVQSQKYPNLEHIVVDGGSTDESVQILKDYSTQAEWKHLRWISEPDDGQSDALNKGFRMARGEIIGWLNSDDVYRPSCLHHVIEAFQRFKDADIIYGDYTWIDSEGRLLQLRRETSFSEFVLLYHRVLYIPTTATFMRRRFIDEGNLIDKSYRYSMDYEFFVRLTTKGYRFKHISSLLADFRWQPDSKSSKAPQLQFSELNAALAAHRSWVGQGGTPARILLKLARICAAARRVAEKAARGYYLDQFRPPATLRGSGS